VIVGAEPSRAPRHDGVLVCTEANLQGLEWSCLAKRTLLKRPEAGAQIRHGCLDYSTACAN